MLEVLQFGKPEVDQLLNEGKLELKRAIYEVHETIDLGNHYGIQLSGFGMGPQKLPNLSPNFRVFSSILVWKGPVGKPMFHMSGLYYKFENITVWGDGSSPLFIVRYQPGIGSGKHQWKDCVFSDCGHAIVHGENLDDNNCDLFRITNCHFFNCISAIRINNQQCVGGQAEAIRAVNCETVFDLEAGSMSADGVVIHSAQLLLRMHNQGTNNCRIDFRGLTIDNKQRDNFTLVRHDLPKREHHITLSGLLGNWQRKPIEELSNVPIDASALKGWGEKRQGASR